MNRQGVSHQYLTLSMWLCLLTTLPIFAKPRPAAPPMPESHLQLWRFDNAAEFNANNKTPSDVSGVTSSESWTGYSLRVAGDKPARIAFPEINAAGKTNLAFNHGALRLWFRGDWSSAGLGGKGPGSDARLLSLHSATKAVVTERALAFDPSGDSLYCADVNGEQLLQAKISWPAGSWHQVALNYSATGTALFLDGALVAKGQGVVAWPKAAERFFTLGSDSNGENLAQGEFEEFTTFARNLTAEEIAANYRTGAAVAQLGPITPEEEAAKKEHQAKLIAGRKSASMQMSLAPPGGGGGTNSAGGGYSYLTAQTGLRLVDPAWQSNVFTATIAGGEEGGRYDLFFTTNLSVTNAWSFVTRTAPGQTNLVVAPADPGFFLLGTMQDADGDTLTDAYEALVSKTDPSAFTSYASTGGTGALAAVLFDEPAVVRISQVNIYEEFAPHCPVIPSLVPAAGNTTDLNWAWGQGGSSLSNLWFLSCPGNGHIGSFYAQTLWNSNDVASCETWYAGQSHVAGTNCSAPPTNFPAEYCLIAAAAGDNTFVRTAATAVELVTGGPKFSLSSNLFLIHVTATERTNSPLTGAGLSMGLKATNITATNITIFGQPLNTNGDLYILLTDQQTNTITPAFPASYSNYVFSVEVVKAKLKILQADQNGANATNINEVVKVRWVGQENNLTCVLDPAIAGMTNFQWTVPGERIRFWGSPSNDIVNLAVNVPLDQSWLTNSGVIFYWMDETNTTVECKVMVKGFEIKSTASFEVRRPQINLFASVLGTIALDNNYSLGQSLHFGDNTSNGTRGIIFNVWQTNANMKGYPGPWHEDFRFVQTGSSLEQYNHTNGTCISNFGQGLDNGTNTSYTYNRFRPVSTNDPPGQTTTNMYTTDSPGSATAPFMSQILRNNNLEMHLVFLPKSTGNAMPVSLWKMLWSWSAKATPSGIISNLTVYPSNLTAIRTSYSPTWSNNIVNRQYTTNSTPCP